MMTKRTVVRGLSFDLVVVETTQCDRIGPLFYVAAICLLNRKTGTERLIRRTRIPGCAAEIVLDIQNRGLRALDECVFSPQNNR